MAALSVVPASSMKASGRWVNSSVSFDAIQTKRGESITFLPRRFVLTM
jgi:hypothetical protein